MTRILDYHIGSNHGMVNGGHVYRVGTCTVYQVGTCISSR